MSVTKRDLLNYLQSLSDKELNQKLVVTIPFYDGYNNNTINVIANVDVTVEQITYDGKLYSDNITIDAEIDTYVASDRCYLDHEDIVAYNNGEVDLERLRSYFEPGYAYVDRVEFNISSD